MKKTINIILLLVVVNVLQAQNYSYNFAATGRRVCLVQLNGAA